MKFDIASVKKADIKNKRVFLAVDLNDAVLKDGRVVDSYRVARSGRTFDLLKKNGARTLLVSHRTEESASLQPVFEYVKTLYPAVFARTLNEADYLMKSAPAGSFVMLENIRKLAGEKEKKNDKIFAKELASLADVYVNEAFSRSHRAHASIVGVPEFLPSFAGFLFLDEVTHLSKAFNPPKPFVFLLAGAKFETKFPLVEKFLKSADSVFIGGALANDLFKAEGYEIGLSKHSGGNFNFNYITRNSKLLLPTDVVTENAGTKITKNATEVSSGDNIFDAGPKTVALLAEKFASAKFILWNGTLGVYEDGYKEGTVALAKAIVASGIESIIGGGDTIASVSSLGLLDKFSFVSTGGGAMLDFLANETLPGIAALERNAGVRG
jgi:phosphoglycerate kinase